MWLMRPLYREWFSPFLHASQRMPTAPETPQLPGLLTVKSAVPGFILEHHTTELLSFGIWFDREMALIAIKSCYCSVTYNYGCFDIQDTISCSIRVRIKKVSTLPSIHQSCLHSCQNPNLLHLIFKLIFKFLPINIIYAILQAWSEKSVTK